MRYKQVSLKREKLEMSPVYSTAFEHAGHTLGYIRLVNFSQHAAADMRKAITRLQVRRRRDHTMRHLILSTRLIPNAQLHRLLTSRSSENVRMQLGCQWICGLPQSEPQVTLPQPKPYP